MRGRGRNPSQPLHPLLQSNQVKKKKTILSFFNGGVGRHITHPRHKPPDPAYLEQYTREHRVDQAAIFVDSAPMAPGKITNHQSKKQKGKGGELTWCHSASQAAFDGLLKCRERRGRNDDGPASELRLRSHCRPSSPTTHPPPHRVTFGVQQISMANGP